MAIQYTSADSLGKLNTLQLTLTFCDTLRAAELCPAHQSLCGTLTLPTQSHEATVTQCHPLSLPWLQPVRAGCQNAPSPSALSRHKEIRLWHAPKLHQTGYFTASIWSTHGSKELSDRREKRLTISAGLRGWEERLSLFTVSYTRSIWLSAALTSSSASTREVLDWWDALQEQGTSPQKSPVMKESATGDGEQSSWGSVTLGDTQMMKWQHWPQALCELFALKPTPLKPTVQNDLPS